ncbi:tetratricopeptide repeat protein [Ktedonobacteria bacterium brp13]|nr:tetratricopeptide repeat protein [Ktedonobacteria bacterium brp13]
MRIVGPNDQLRTLRKRRGLARKQLAEMLGISHFTIGRWERGELFPSTVMLDRLCTLFGCSPLELGFHAHPASVQSDELATPTTEQPADSAASSAPFELSPSAAARPTIQTPLSTLNVGSDVPFVAAASSALPLYEPCFDPTIPLRVSPALVGRAELQAMLRVRFQMSRAGVFIALHGLPGMGKTALASTLSHDEAVRAHFSDGVLWAGLGPHPNLQALFNRWGTLLGLPASVTGNLSGVEEWSKTLRQAIGQRKILIVVDDAWQLEEALACKIGGEQCRHLVTTRFPSLAAQLAVEDVVQLQELNETEGIALINTLAPGVITVDEQPGLELVRAVGGLPLALTLIGNYLRSQQESGEEQRVQSALRLLKDMAVRLRISEPQHPSTRHSSLPADTPLSLLSIIAATDQLLNTVVRTVFYTLSLLPAKPESFAEEMALVLADCSADELDQLMDAGLLECTVGDRYLLHQVIADYARLHLSEEEKGRSGMRLIRYIIEYLKQHRKDHELLDRESSTILTALELAYTLELRAELIQAVCAFAPFLILRGFYGQADLQLRRAYEAAEALNDDGGRAHTLLYLGDMALKQSSFTEAEKYLQDSLLLAIATNDQGCVCDVLTSLGSIAWRMGEYAQAEEILQKGLQVAYALESHERQEHVLKTLGLVYMSRGDIDRSAAMMREVLALARQVGDREQECVILSNIGALVGERGDHAQAEELFDEALQLARQIGHREQTCVLLLNLGNLSKEHNNYEQAKNYFDEGLQLARQIRYPEWISVLLCDLGSIFLMQDDAEQAEHYLNESLLVARQVGRPHILCNVMQQYGYFYLAQQQYQQAEAYFREMLQEVPDGDQLWYAFAHYGLGQVAEALDNYSEAYRLGEIALQNLVMLDHGHARAVRSWLEDLPEVSE